MTRDEYADLTVDEIRHRIRLCDEQTEAVIHASTEQQLARLRAERHALADAEHAATKRANANVPPATDREIKIRDAIRQTQALEHHEILQVGGHLAEKFIRPDAVAHFRADLDARRESMNSLFARFTDVMRPGPRAFAQRQELERDEADWRRTERYCRVGETIARLRQERKRLTNQLSELEAERRAGVGA